MSDQPAELNLTSEAAETILREHWQTVERWGGVLRPACGRCAYTDGVRYLWPCPTRRAITGEPAPDPTQPPEATEYEHGPEAYPDVQVQPCGCPACFTVNPSEIGPADA